MNKILKGKPAGYQDFIVFRRLELLKQFPNFFNSDFNLIDIGCGNGATLLNIHNQYNSCHGIDIEPKSILLFNSLLPVLRLRIK